MPSHAGWSYLHRCRRGPYLQYLRSYDHLKIANGKQSHATTVWAKRLNFGSELRLYTGYLTVNLCGSCPLRLRDISHWILRKIQIALDRLKLKMPRRFGHQVIANLPRNKSQNRTIAVFSTEKPLQNVKVSSFYVKIPPNVVAGNTRKL